MGNVVTTRGWGDRHPASEEVTEENLLVSVLCKHNRPVAEVHQTSHGLYGWAATPLLGTDTAQVAYERERRDAGLPRQPSMAFITDFILDDSGTVQAGCEKCSTGELIDLRKLRERALTARANKKPVKVGLTKCGPRQPRAPGPL